MKRLLSALLLCCLALAPLRADPLGKTLEVVPTEGWKSVDASIPGEPLPPFPILKFVPKDGRNAAIFLSLVPANVPGYEVTDLDSLKRFTFNAAKPYLPDPSARPAVTELKVAGGIGISITNEDPALTGKPVPPNEYRIVTTATILLDGQYLIHASIFYDELDSREFKEGLKILLSVSARAKSPAI